MKRFEIGKTYEANASFYADGCNIDVYRSFTVTDRQTRETLLGHTVEIILVDQNIERIEISDGDTNALMDTITGYWDIQEYLKENDLEEVTTTRYFVLNSKIYEKLGFESACSSCMGSGYEDYINCKEEA